MKRNIKRLLAITVAMVMLIGMLPILALAYTDDDADKDVVVDVVDDVVVDDDADADKDVDADVDADADADADKDADDDADVDADENKDNDENKDENYKCAAVKINATAGVFMMMAYDITENEGPCADEIEWGPPLSNPPSPKTPNTGPGEGTMITDCGLTIVISHQSNEGQPIVVGYNGVWFQVHNAQEGTGSTDTIEIFGRSFVINWQGNTLLSITEMSDNRAPGNGGEEDCKCPPCEGCDGNKCEDCDCDKCTPCTCDCDCGECEDCDPPVYVNWTINHRNYHTMDLLYQQTGTDRIYTELRAVDLSGEFDGFEFYRFSPDYIVLTDGANVIDVLYREIGCGPDCDCPECEPTIWTVTFVLSGGVYSGNQDLLVQEVKDGEDATPLSAFPTRTGFVFNGWNQALNLTAVDEDRLFIAQWTPVGGQPPVDPPEDPPADPPPVDDPPVVVPVVTPPVVDEDEEETVEITAPAVPLAPAPAEADEEDDEIIIAAPQVPLAAPEAPSPYIWLLTLLIFPLLLLVWIIRQRITTRTEKTDD